MKCTSSSLSPTFPNRIRSHSQWANGLFSFLHALLCSKFFARFILVFDQGHFMHAAIKCYACVCVCVCMHSTQFAVPVTGASISIIVFSDLSRAAPSCMIRKAAASSIRPSSIKCCLSTSDWGLPVRASNTSAAVNLWLGGKGTPAFAFCLFVRTICIKWENEKENNNNNKNKLEISKLISVKWFGRKTEVHTINGSIGGRVLFLCSWLILCLLWLLLICCRRWWCCGATCCCIGCRCTCTRMLLIRRHFQSIYSLWFPLSLLH